MLAQHPERKEIARYLLSRGLDRPPDEGAAGDRAMPMLRMPARTGRARAGARAAKHVIAFPEGLAPTPQPIDPAPGPDAALPRADVVVITWTADETDALAEVFTPGHSRAKWYRYARGFDTYKSKIRAGAPARNAGCLGSYFPTQIGTQRVLAMKSELHLNQDGISELDDHGHSTGRATLPVKDFFLQIIAETQAGVVLTIGTAGAVFDDFGLGDVVVTRAAKFRCRQEFRNEPFNNKRYTSRWDIPTTHFATAEKLMKSLERDLREPPVGPPTTDYAEATLQPPTVRHPRIRLDGRDMKANHPILTTDYFEYGTTANRLDRFGSAVEMGDAALGLACSELPDPPRWAVVRNMSDPVINGDLPAKQTYHLNEQTTWAVAFYTAYGKYTSVMGALATWAVIAGL